MKIEHVLFPSVFSKIKNPFDGRSFLMCSHEPFFGTNKNRILKNGSRVTEQALILYSQAAFLSASLHMTRNSAHTNGGCEDSSPSITIKRT